MEAIPYTITDEEIRSKIDMFSLDQYIRKKYNRSVYSKCFLNSIFSVKNPISQIALLDYLKYGLGNGAYHITISEIVQLYQVLFNDLPNNKCLQQNLEYENSLFGCMNVFMVRFYNTVYPYFYDIDNDESLFSYDTNFVINYLNNMNIRKYPNEIYYDQLLNDGSYTNILNYLFELLFDGIEYDKISKTIDNLFVSIDHNFIMNYFVKKNFLSKSSAIYVNHQKKSIFLMHNMISFYEKQTSEIIQVVESQNRQMRHEQNKEKFKQMNFQDIISPHLFEFLESFLFNYTERLISEGRLINTQNPFKSDQEIQKESYKFYPETVDDNVIYKCLNIISNLIIIFPKDEMILNYFPIFSSIYRIIPGIFLFYDEKSTRLLFEYLQESDLKKFDILKNIFYETIRDRIIGNYKTDYNSIQKYLAFEKHDLKSESILTFVSQLLSVVSLTDFFKKLHFDNIEHHLQLFCIIYKYSKQKKFGNLTNVKLYLLLYYKEYSTRPEIMTKYMKTLIDLPTKHINHLTESIKNIINYILNDPKIADTIDLNLIVNFFQKNKNIDFDISSLESLLQVCMKNCDMLKIQLICILLGDRDSETSQEYTKKVVQKKLNSNYFENQ